MAGIDKTYVNNWDDYCAIVEWCKNNSFTFPNGIEVRFGYYEWNEESFIDGKELPVLNTSYTQDYFLIKHCPIKVVQERMREVYPGHYVQSILDNKEENVNLLLNNYENKITLRNI